MDRRVCYEYIEYCAPNDTAYKRCSCNGGTNCRANCVKTFRPQQCGPDLPFLSKPAMRTHWMAGAGDVETDPGRTTTYKRVWICDIFHKQIHGMKRISVKCNNTQYRDTSTNRTLCEVVVDHVLQIQTYNRQSNPLDCFCRP